jgi:HEXXH motif-containing protein
VAGAMVTGSTVRTQALRRPCVGVVSLLLVGRASKIGQASARERACVHENQHIKLSVLLDQMPVTHQSITLASGTCRSAPWRLDPRPVIGLLQGIYAYLGVTGFWRRR